MNCFTAGPRFLAAAVFCLAQLAAACRNDPSITDARLSDGSDLNTHLQRADTIIALFYDPADCFVCESPLSGWNRWVRQGARRGVVLTLTRMPTNAERDLLVVSRLNDTPWLVEGSAIRNSPAAYAFIRGIARDSAHGRRGIGAFYDKWSQP